VTARLYKVLVEDGTASQSGYRWPLPENGAPGPWVSVTGPLVRCEHGLHLAPGERGLLEYLDRGPVVWLAEPWPSCRVHDYGIEVVVRRARLVRQVEGWTEATARLFAADCAERALLRERAAGREPARRSWRAIEVARQRARGEATDEQLAAAGACARPAARDARAAARSAAWAAAAAADAWAAAAAADAAAWAAADAARDAAGAAERDWQAERLRLYLDGTDPAEMPGVWP